MKTQFKVLESRAGVGFTYRAGQIVTVGEDIDPLVVKDLLRAGALEPLVKQPERATRTAPQQRTKLEAPPIRNTFVPRRTTVAKGMSHGSAAGDATDK